MEYLTYIHDKEKRIEELIEVKFSEENISKHLIYYAERLKPRKATQIVANLKRPYDRGRIRVMDPVSYFQ